MAHDDYLQDPVLGHHFQGYAVSDGQVTWRTSAMPGPTTS